MKKILFLPFFVTFFISLSFITASFNQTFAANVNEPCSVRSDGTGPANGGCNPGLSCDTQFVPNFPNNCGGSADHGSCAGICRKNCGSYVGGPSGDSLCASSETCYHTADDHYGYNGYCIPDDSPHVELRSTCTRKVSGSARGNCKDANAVCNTTIDTTCSSGTCQGTCMPAQYSCDVIHDSRSGLSSFSCPLQFTCTEAQNRVPLSPENPPGQVCTRDESGIENCTPSCENCVWSCLASKIVDVTCTCEKEGDASTADPANHKGNSIHCTNSTKDMHTACQDTDHACYNSPHTAFDNNDLRNEFGTLPKTGIVCQKPAEHAGITQGLPPCAKSGPNGTCAEVLTAFGPVSTDPSGFITKLFSILLGAAGSIALLLFMRAGYRIITARGNAEGIKEGREQLVAAIIGLMFLIFSFVILQVIGVDLLRIPSSGGIPLNGTCDVNNPQCASGLVCKYSGSQGQCQNP